jgi:hypothetical protein
MMGKLKDREGRRSRPLIYVVFTCDGKVKNANALTWSYYELRVTSMMDDFTAFYFGVAELLNGPDKYKQDRYC